MVWRLGLTQWINLFTFAITLNHFWPTRISGCTKKLDACASSGSKRVSFILDSVRANDKQHILYWPVQNMRFFRAPSTPGTFGGGGSPCMGRSVRGAHTHKWKYVQLRAGNLTSLHVGVIKRVIQWELNLQMTSSRNGIKLALYVARWIANLKS